MMKKQRFFFFLTVFLGLVLAFPLDYSSAAAAKQPDGFSRLTRQQQDAIKKYVRVAVSQLNDLPDFIKKGKDGSSWANACVKTENELEDLRTEINSNKELEIWFEKHADAWKQLRLIGGQIAASNADLVEGLDKLHAIEIPRSEAMLTSISTTIKEGLNNAMNETVEKSKKLLNYSSDVAKITMDSGTPLDDLLDAAKEVKSLKGEVERGFGRIQRAETLARRILDKAIRAKSVFLSQMERDSQAIRRSLTKMKSKKIDSFGSGMFALAEKAIEDQAFEHLDDYREALEKWSEINAPFLKADAGDALELFGETTYALATMDLPKSWGPIKIPRAGSYKSRGNRAFTLFSAAAKTAFREGWDKWSKDYYERIEISLIDEEDKISLATGEAKMALDKGQLALEEKLSMRRAELQEANEKELAILKRHLLGKGDDLYAVIREIGDVSIDLKSNDSELLEITKKSITKLASQRDKLDAEVAELQETFILQEKSLPQMLAREDTAPWYVKQKKALKEDYDQTTSKLKLKLEALKRKQGQL